MKNTVNIKRQDICINVMKVIHSFLLINRFMPTPNFVAEKLDLTLNEVKIIWEDATSINTIGYFPGAKLQSIEHLTPFIKKPLGIVMIMPLIYQFN